MVLACRSRMPGSSEAYRRWPREVAGVPSGESEKAVVAMIGVDSITGCRRRTFSRVCDCNGQDLRIEEPRGSLGPVADLWWRQGDAAGRLPGGRPDDREGHVRLVRGSRRRSASYRACSLLHARHLRPCASGPRTGARRHAQVRASPHLGLRGTREQDQDCGNPLHCRRSEESAWSSSDTSNAHSGAHPRGSRPFIERLRHFYTDGAAARV
jgi:hypothetical protein